MIEIMRKHPGRIEKEKKMSIFARFSRRSFLTKASLTGTLGALPLGASTIKKPVGPSVYEALGVKHVINATGTVTNLGARFQHPKW